IHVGAVRARLRHGPPRLSLAQEPAGTGGNGTAIDHAAAERDELTVLTPPAAATCAPPTRSTIHDFVTQLSSPNASINHAAKCPSRIAESFFTASRGYVRSFLQFWLA